MSEGKSSVRALEGMRIADGSCIDVDEETGVDLHYW